MGGTIAFTCLGERKGGGQLIRLCELLTGAAERSIDEYSTGVAAIAVKGQKQSCVITLTFGTLTGKSASEG